MPSEAGAAKASGRAGQEDDPHQNCQTLGTERLVTAFLEGCYGEQGADCSATPTVRPVQQQGQWT